MNDGGNKVVDFDGGYYLTYTYRDGDEETNGRLLMKLWNTSKAQRFLSWICALIIMQWDILSHPRRL